MAAVAVLLTSPVPGSAADEAESLALADLIEKVEPSCVRLDVTTPDGKAIGSGFIVQNSDWVVTNHHVVAGAKQASVTLVDGTKIEVEGFLAYGVQRDVAVVKLKSDSKRKPLQLADKLPRKGDDVVAIGAPQGLSFTATQGIVSAIRDGKELAEFGNDAIGTWLQTSTPISPGSSGGPLLNLRGEVVGANSGSLASGQNLNFAISAADIQSILDTAAKSKLRALASIEPLKPARPTPRPRRPGGSASPDDPPPQPIACQLPFERKFSHRLRIAKEEDEFDKVVWLRTDWMPLKHNHRGLTSCGLRVSVPFGEDTPPPAVLWEIGTTARSFAFLTDESRRFQLLAVGEDAAEASPPQHKGDIVPGGGVSEKLTKAVPLDYFLELIMAKEAKGRLGEMTYELTPDQMECLREVASRLPTGTSADGRVEVSRRTWEDDPTIPASLRNILKSKAAAAAKAAEGPARVEQPFRTWTSADGKFTVEAQLVKVEEGKALLRRKDNRQEISVPLAVLSAADQAHLKQRDRDP